MAMPDVTVEIAWNSGFTTPAASRTWTGVTAYVEAQRGLSIERGRADQHSTVQPSRLSLTLDNSDGRFTPEYAAGAYYPNVKKGRPIRVRVKGNLLSSENAASMETSTADWRAAAASVHPVAPTITHDTGNGFDGTKSLRATWPSAGNGMVGTVVTGLTVGATYTFSCYLKNIVGGGSVNAQVVALPAETTAEIGSGNGGSSSWTRVSVTFTATVTSYLVGARGGLGASDSFDVDAALLESGSTPTPYLFWRDLFTGYLDKIPVEWPGGSSTMSTVTISATSRMARLGKSAEFKSIVEEEILYDDPVLYFPLGEPAGSTTAGNITPGRSDVLTVAQVGSGGTLEFGAGIGPGTDDLTAPIFTPVDASNGAYLRTVLVDPVPVPGDTVIDVEVWFVTSTTGRQLFYLEAPSGGVFTGRMSGNFITIDGTIGSGFSTASAGSPAVNDDLLHHLSARFALSGGNAAVSYMLDGAARVSDASPIAGVSALPAFKTFAIGQDIQQNNKLWAGTIAHVDVYSGTVAPADARIVEHYTAGVDGFAGESSDLRIDRYARLASIPTAEVSTGAGLSTSIAHKDTTGEAPLAAMEAIALTEDGVLFDGRDGVLTFQSRSHRYNSTSAFTLSCTAGEVEADLSPVHDDQGMTNDMTASRPNGVTVRSVNQTSIDEFGYYRDMVEILTTSDAEVQARADWQVNRFGTPRVKLTDVSVDLIASSSALKTALLAADIGTRFTVSNMPAQAPASSMDFFIEGISYDIGPEFFTVHFNTSAAAYADVWLLDSSTFSVLGSTTVLAY